MSYTTHIFDGFFPYHLATEHSCLTCQRTGPTQSKCTPVKCPAIFSKCLNVTYDVQVQHAGEVKTFPGWQAGCGSAAQCEFSGDELCQETQESLTRSLQGVQAKVEVQNCQLSCKDSHADPGTVDMQDEDKGKIFVD